MPVPYYVHKFTALPAPLMADSIHFVAPPAFPGCIEIHVTDAAGLVSRKTLDRSTVQTMIDAAVAAGSSGMVLVDDIAARDAPDPVNAQTILVVDAAADPGVNAGWASHIWRESTST